MPRHKAQLGLRACLSRRSGRLDLNDSRIALKRRQARELRAFFDILRMELSSRIRPKTLVKFTGDEVLNSGIERLPVPGEVGGHTSIRLRNHNLTFSFDPLTAERPTISAWTKVDPPFAVQTLHNFFHNSKCRVTRSVVGSADVNIWHWSLFRRAQRGWSALGSDPPRSQSLNRCNSSRTCLITHPTTTTSSKYPTASRRQLAAEPPAPLPRRKHLCADDAGLRGP